MKMIEQNDTLFFLSELGGIYDPMLVKQAVQLLTAYERPFGFFHKRDIRNVLELLREVDGEADIKNICMQQLISQPQPSERHKLPMP